MASKALASLNIILGVIPNALYKGLAAVQKRVAKFAVQMKAIGRSITYSFTLPFAAVGVAGAKMAVDFQTAMTKINTLVGISAKEVNEYGKTVKSMAIETATAPEKLAEGLFFITSAGFKGKEALDALRVSAKGAAMQMGDMQDIASATTSIMTAYGHSSEKAGDLLHETLKQGKFDAAEFMSKIGQVIPTAASFGISFEEMGAAVATMSKISGDAAGSLTAVNQVMLKLMTPGEQQKEILKDINMEYDDLNAMMKDSLMGTLNHIFKELEGNDEMLTKVFGGARAVKGAFATAGLQAETYAEVLDGMNNSLGNVDKGFKTVSETAEFKMTQSWEQLKATTMELGAMLMPVFTKIVNVLTKAANAFRDLDKDTKGLVVGLGALVAFSGPLMTLGGTLLSVFSMLLSPIGLTVVAIGALFKVIYDNWGATKKIFVDFINYWIDLYNESMFFRAVIESFKLVFKQAYTHVAFFFKSALQAAKNFGGIFTDMFGGIGDIIKGIFTWDEKLLEDGAKRFGEAFSDTFGGPEMDKISKEWNEVLDENVNKAIENVVGREKVEFITEEQVQGAIDDLGKLLGDKWVQIKDKIKELIGDTTLGVPEVGDEGDGSSQTGDSGKDDENAVAKKKSIWQQYWNWAKGGWDDWAQNIANVTAEVTARMSDVVNAVGALWAAQHEKRMTEIANEREATVGALEADMEAHLSHIEQSNASDERKEKAAAQIKKKYQKQIEAEQKLIDKKEAAAKLKKAKQDKALAIFGAIVNTANAVANALTAGPILGPILAGIVGGLGAAQIAVISSTPLPALAQGGLAYGSTLAMVGDNPNAKTDPEVIAPLSKLAQYMGGGKQEIEVHGVVSGADILITSDKSTTKNARYI